MSISGIANVFRSVAFEFPRRFREFSNFHSLRWRMHKEGVELSSSAMLYGAFGIKLGRGSTIHRGATLAAINLHEVHAQRVYAKNAGRILCGERCQVLPGAIIASYGGIIEIGDDVSINPNCVIYGHGGLRIGSNSRIAAGTVIIPANHDFADITQVVRLQGMSRKGIDIGSDVWIGSGARILDGVSIGDGAVVASGAVVTKSVESLQIVAGVPARPIGKRGQSQAHQTAVGEKTDEVFN